MRKSRGARPIRHSLLAPLALLAVATIAVALTAGLANAGGLVVLAVVAVGICSTVVVAPAALLVGFRANRAAVARQRAEEAEARAAAVEAERAYQKANCGPLGVLRRGVRKVVARRVPQAQRITDSFTLSSRSGYSHPYATPLAHPGTDGGWDSFAPAAMLLTTVAITTTL